VRGAAILPTAGVFPGIYDADHPLGAGMDMHISGLDGLLRTAPVPIECLEQFSLQFEQLNSVAAIDLDVVLIDINLADFSAIFAIYWLLPTFLLTI
jgi:hypothetical protein